MARFPTLAPWHHVIDVETERALVLGQLSCTGHCFELHLNLSWSDNRAEGGLVCKTKPALARTCIEGLECRSCL